MPAIFKKLNLKDRSEIPVLDSPESFEPEIAALEDGHWPPHFRLLCSLR